MMASVRARENKAEVALRKALWRLGFRYRVQERRLIGRPDVVLPKYRAVIFVDGDFWHGRALAEGGDEGLRQVVRGERFEWWRDKLSRTIQRDAHVTDQLTAAGWRVIRVWESDLLNDFEGSVSRVSASLKSTPDSTNRQTPG
jgi:DNA mismatch endonuclease (patch repair protein)